MFIFYYFYNYYLKINYFINNLSLIVILKENSVFNHYFKNFLYILFFYLITILKIN